MGGGGGADMGGGGGADTGGGGAGGFGNGPTSPGGDYSQDTPAPREQPTLQHMNDHVTDDMTPDEIHDATEMQRELELQQRELAVQENALRLKEKELVLRQKEMTLELQQQAIDEQLAAMAAQGITVQMPEMPVPPAPAPAPAPVAPPAAAPLGLVAEPEPFVPSEGAQQFTFLVTRSASLPLPPRSLPAAPSPLLLAPSLWPGHRRPGPIAGQARSLTENRSPVLAMIFSTTSGNARSWPQTCRS